MVNTFPRGHVLSSPCVTGDRHGHSSHFHSVFLYETDLGLSTPVARYLEEGLAADESTVVVATAAHREGFASQLQTAGVDVAKWVASGRVTFLDAELTLASLLEGARPERSRFEKVVGGVLHAARKASPSGKVRAYGEMVDLLYRRESPEGAIALEGLWNELAAKDPFSLMCAYRANHFVGPGSGPRLEQIRGVHDVDAGVEEEREYQLSTAPESLGLMSDGKRCFEHYFGLASPCGGCPALRAASEPWPRMQVRRSAHQPGVFLLTRAEQVGPSKVQVRVRSFSNAEVVAMKDHLQQEQVDKAGLTQRERAVFDHLVAGTPIEGISGALNITPRTVKFHISNLLAKFGAESQADLLRLIA